MAMCGILATLLCVELLLQYSLKSHGERPLLMDRGQDGALPPPRVTVTTGSLIPEGQPVTITCSGHPNAEHYWFSKVETPGGLAQQHVQLGNTLHLPFMTKESAGLYICSYEVGHAWSPQSDPLPLVMTGAYDKPSLNSVPDTVVRVGQQVQMHCFSQVRFDELLLIQESGLQTPQTPSIPPGGGSQASFIMDPVKSTQAGSYRCFGHFHETPYVWSHPSDPVQLQVKEAPFTALPERPAQPTEPRHRLRTTEPRHGTDFSATGIDCPGRSWHCPTAPVTSHPPGHPGFLTQHRSVLIGVPIAAILLLLLLLLVRHYRAQATRQRQAGAEQGQSTDAPREVTYAQVTCTVAKTTKPSLLPTGTYISEYATLALK